MQDCLKNPATILQQSCWMQDCLNSRNRRSFHISTKIFTKKLLIICRLQKWGFWKTGFRPKKTGSGHPGDIIDMGDHENGSIWEYLNDGLKKIWKNGRFIAKPETRQNLSGKIFASGIFFLSVDFKYTFIFSIYKVNPKIWSKWLKLVTRTE